MAAVACPYMLPHLRSSSLLARNNKQRSLVENPRSNHLARQGKANRRFIHSLNRGPRLAPLYAALNNPKGFGPSPKKTKRGKRPKPGEKREDEEEEEDEYDDDDEREAGVIPEIVTNRMIGRMGFTVGIPLFIGLLFFPFFYYLKVGLKIDIPMWVPVIVSFIFFGTALLGVSYGIVSSSWDPLREGSLIGWNEAQKNWPVFWQSLRGSSSRNK